MPITGALLVMLALLILSYRETIKAYPSAGGAYLVTRDNFGIVPAQVAGAALLVGYILTVSVSVSAGTAALISSFDALSPLRVPISLGFIAIVMYGNLRGVKESGQGLRRPHLLLHAQHGRAARRTASCSYVGGDLAAITAVRRRATSHDRRRSGQRRALLRRQRLRARQGVRLRRRGGHRRGGHLQRRPGVPGAGVEATPARRSWSWASGLGVMFLGLSLLASKIEGAPVRGRHAHRAGPDRRGRLRHRHGRRGASATRCRPPPCSSWCWPPTPASPTSRAWPASRPATASCPASSPSAATGSCSPTASSPWPAAAGLLVVVTNAEVTKLIPLYAIGVFVGFTLSQAGHDEAPPAAQGAGLAARPRRQRRRRAALRRRRGDRAHHPVRRRLGDARRHAAVRGRCCSASTGSTSARPSSSSTTCRPPPPRRSCAATWCWCSSTGSTWPRPAPSSTPARSRPTSCGPCTSSSTRRRPRSWPTSGRAPACSACRWSSSTAPTAGSPAPRWSASSASWPTARPRCRCSSPTASTGASGTACCTTRRPTRSSSRCRACPTPTSPRCRSTSTPRARSGCRCRPSSPAAAARQGEGRQSTPPLPTTADGDADVTITLVPGCLPIADATLAATGARSPAGSAPCGSPLSTTRRPWS